MKANAVYQLGTDPIVWISCGPKHWDRLENNGDAPAFLLAHPAWNFGWRSIVDYHRFSRSLKRRNIELVVLNNDERQHRLARRAGLRSAPFNHNIHCCEHEFRPAVEVQRDFDAIYVAAAQHYKRLDLAGQVRKLYVVTYFWPDVRNEAGEWDLHAFEPRIGHCDYNRHRLAPAEVNAMLNRSRCGLALSKKEGAMLASMEYLLAGHDGWRFGWTWANRRPLQFRDARNHRS